MKNIKIFVKSMGIIVLSAVLLIALAACASTDENAKPGASDAAENPADNNNNGDGGNNGEENGRLQPVLPDVNYNGDVFTFLVNEFAGAEKYWGSYEIYAEEENGDAINDAVYKRNRTIEEKLNINIKEIRADYLDTVSYTKRSVAAGDSEYDCVMPRMWNAAALASEGYLLSLDRLPFIDLSNPWWDQNAKDTSIGGRQFFTVGDLMVMDKDSLFIVMFNKTAAMDGGVENLYNLVRENKWTMDKFHALIKDAARDLNGDGKLGFDDMAGLLTSSWCLSFMYFGTGETVTRKDPDDYPYFVMNNERGIRAAEKAYEIICDKGATVLGETIGMDNPYEALNRMFQEDRGLFMMMQIMYIHRTRTMESDFGILPMPKLDEKQDKYYTAMNPVATSCIAIPVTVKSPEKTSVILEALSAESKYTLIPAYYDITITNKMIRDEESAEMLDIILASRIYDLGFVFNWGDIGNVPLALYPNGGNFVSTYEKREPKALSEMEKTIEAFKDLSE